MPQPRSARARGCRAFPRQPDHTPSPPSTPLKRLFLPLVFLTSPMLEKVICSLHDPTNPLLPAASSALSPGTAGEAEPPSAGAHGDAELQDELGQGKIPTGVRRGPCVRPALLQLGFNLVSLPLGRRLKGLH